MLRTRIHEYFDTHDEREMQRKLLALLESKKWDISRTAKQLGVSDHTLWRVLRQRPNLARARLQARLKMALETGRNPGIK
jgi:transcriptional regulator of acetoin/glycerol metabolism